MRLTNMQLVKIASCTGFAAVSLGLLTRWKINDRLRQTDYYRDAMKTLRKHRAAVTLLGEPIKDGNVNVSSDTNTADQFAANIAIPVRGPKAKGTMHIWAKKDVDNNKWDVHRIELSLKDDPSRRLLVKNVANN